ncbi:hypothetical protein GCM10025859_39540 [Alicyclobacillus fastidiosus]|nr:hypothetical protein GCM10025859_39470 [Alicyclobacillus fastidiosus]GMA63514.1 hypothetical protein GCM10025859_39540 [Alicyclobacillus fastidiosus]
MSVSSSKNGENKYVEAADRENFARYNFTLPASSHIEKGDIFTAEVISIRTFRDRVTLEGTLIESKPNK